MKHFLEVTHLTKSEIEHVLELSEELHQNKVNALHQKNVLFCFEKPSLRTKVGTEVAINQLDGSVIHIDPVAFLGGKIMHAKSIPDHDERESLKDTVLNVSKWCDAIFVRVFNHQTLEKLCKYSQIPIINALSDLHHPMQVLADFRTIQQVFGKERVTITFVGDANNVAKSLIEMGIMLGYSMRFSGPPSFSWSKQMQAHFSSLASAYEGSYTHYSDPKEAAIQSLVIYTDTFVSMGEEDSYENKMKHFQSYQINQSLFDRAPKDARFMHCLPAHRGVEVTNEVIDSEYSMVYEQAENRMVVSKGLFTFLIKEKGELNEHF